MKSDLPEPLGVDIAVGNTGQKHANQSSPINLFACILPLLSQIFFFISKGISMKCLFFFFFAIKAPAGCTFKVPGRRWRSTRRSALYQTKQLDPKPRLNKTAAVASGGRAALWLCDTPTRPAFVTPPATWSPEMRLIVFATNPNVQRDVPTRAESEQKKKKRPHPWLFFSWSLHSSSFSSLHLAGADAGALIISVYTAITGSCQAQRGGGGGGGFFTSGGV